MFCRQILEPLKSAKRLGIKAFKRLTEDIALDELVEAKRKQGIIDHRSKNMSDSLQSLVNVNYLLSCINQKIWAIHLLTDCKHKTLTWLMSFGETSQFDLNLCTDRRPTGSCFYIF